MSDDKAAVDEQKVIGEQQQQLSAEDIEKTEAVSDYTGKDPKTGQLSMLVRVYSPFRTYYDGPAFSISAENATGAFDILPRHHNFISLLLPCDLTIRTVGKGDQLIRISGGIMHVKADQAIIFLDV